MTNSNPDFRETTTLDEAPEEIGLKISTGGAPSLSIEFSSKAREEQLESFLQITESRRPQLMWLAQRMTKDRQEAEDIVQECIFRAYKSLPHFRGDSQMGTWLCTIVQNIGREWLRKQKGRVFLSLEHARGGNEGFYKYDFPDPSRDPEQVYASRELETILLSEINQMDSVCKDAIKMCSLEEQPLVEAANALGVKVPVIKSRIHSGKRILKRAFHRRICEFDRCGPSEPGLNRRVLRRTAMEPGPGESAYRGRCDD